MLQKNPCAPAYDCPCDGVPARAVAATVPPMPRILIVDDQRSVCTALALLLRLHGFETIVASAPQEALAVIREEDVSLVVQDMNFGRDMTSGEEGVDLMRAIRALDPTVPIVLMTAFTSLEMAVRLIKDGADDYVAKPWNDDKLVATIRNLVRMRQVEQDKARMEAWNARSRHHLAAKYDLCGLQYESPAMHEAVSLAVRVAAADVPVLILGPNGSGKERVAEIVQKNSRRRDRPFVTVNAGALPDALLEAELFGAEAGSFTGAVRSRIGRFEEAHGGTLFLDEIGNLTAQGQMKLLRVLQSGEIQRLGSNASRYVDVRVISATNVDLPKAVANHQFREDLYFRLNVIEIALPPLRDRGDDVVLLARHFLREEARKAGADPVELSLEAEHALLEHDWPGNVRELSNRIQRAILVRRDVRIGPEDLGLVHGPLRPRAGQDGTDDPSLSPEDPFPQAPPETSDAEGECERSEIVRAMQEANGVVSRAAAALGLSRQALYRRAERLGLTIGRTSRG
jgi:DNA-binding NtrC family response regulator